MSEPPRKRRFNLNIVDRGWDPAVLSGHIGHAPEVLSPGSRVVLFGRVSTTAQRDNGSLER
jgi:hypothetical protein